MCVSFIWQIFLLRGGQQGGGNGHKCPPEYRKLVRGPIGNRFVDLLETSSWTSQKPVQRPNRNRFVDLTETGLWT